MRASPRLSLLALIPIALAAPRAWTQTPPVDTVTDSGITVFGNGIVQAKPDAVELDVQSIGSAELASDAIVKYRDGKRRLVSTLEKLEIKSLETSEEGHTINNSAMAAQQRGFVVGGGEAGVAKSQVYIYGTIRLAIRGVGDKSDSDLMDMVGKLLDSAKDAGAIAPQQNTMVRYVVSDITEARERAYAKAVEDARKRAERLASLHGVSLGRVASVKEVLVPGDQTIVYQQNVAQKVSNDPNKLVSYQSGMIPIQVRLQVRFAIKE